MEHKSQSPSPWGFISTSRIFGFSTGHGKIDVCEDLESLEAGKIGVFLFYLPMQLAAPGNS